MEQERDDRRYDGRAQSMGATRAVAQASPHSFSSSYTKINLFTFYAFLVYLDDIVAVFLSEKSDKWMIYIKCGALWASGVIIYQASIGT